MRHSAIRVLALCHILILSACAAAGTAVRAERETCPPPLEAYERHALYFGMSSPLVPGNVITDEVWRAFAEEVLTAHFPEGMTEYEAYGEWRRGDGTHYGEATRVVVHLAPVADEEATAETIRAVIDKAKARFDYQSVLWERSPACVAF